MSYLMSALTKPKDTDQFQTPMPGPHSHVAEVEHEPYDDMIIEVPDIRQNDDYSCGACAAMSVGKYYGVGPLTLSEWKKALGTNVQKSTDPMRIAKYLEQLGLQVTSRQGMSVEDLCYYHKLGVPVICPVQEYGTTDHGYDYGHYVVSIGVGYGYVFVQDSSVDNVMLKEGADSAEGRMIIRKDKFDEVWHDEDLYGKDYDHFGIAVSGPRGG